jgi:hypothetical protein
MARKPDPKSKAGFVRSFPSSTPAAEIVTRGKAKGIKLDVRYVYSVRTAARVKRTKTETATTAPVAKRGPGRPRKSAAVASSGNRSAGRAVASAGGLVAEIERIVEAKVTELLKARLGTLFG